MENTFGDNFKLLLCCWVLFFCFSNITIWHIRYFLIFNTNFICLWIAIVNISSLYLPFIVVIMFRKLFTAFWILPIGRLHFIWFRSLFFVTFILFFLCTVLNCIFLYFYFSYECYTTFSSPYNLLFNFRLFFDSWRQDFRQFCVNILIRRRHIYSVRLFGIHSLSLCLYPLILFT